MKKTGLIKVEITCNRCKYKKVTNLSRQDSIQLLGSLCKHCKKGVLTVLSIKDDDK